LHRWWFRENGDSEMVALLIDYYTFGLEMA
jgi:hypothetical protein